MRLFFEIFQFLFMLFAVIFEYYVIYAFIRSKMGKYPPFVPTRKGMTDIIVREAEFVLSDSDSKKVVEPGCGDARVLIALAKKYPQHTFIGYEWDRFPYTLAKIKTRKYKNITVLRQNFMLTDYKDVNLAVLFTGNEIAQDLAKKLATELPKSAIVISESFKLPLFECIKEVHTEKKNYFFLPQTLYVYRPKA